MTVEVSDDLLVNRPLEQLKQEGEMGNWPVVTEVEWINRSSEAFLRIGVTEANF